MGKAGFAPVDIGLDWLHGYRLEQGYPMIRAVFEKSGKLPQLLPPVADGVEVLRGYIAWSEEAMQDVVRKIDAIDDKTRLALWGISYQAERMFAYTSIAKKNIAALVDNSKQHRIRTVYLQGQERKMQSPDSVEWGNIDKVLITTWNSQDEILDQMKRMGIAEKAIVLYE